MANHPHLMAANHPHLMAFVVPALALAVFATMAALWISGHHAAYSDLLRFFGVSPARSPFIDARGVLSWVECYHHGIDVYVVNPCDPGRLDNYSPLWLAIIPGSVSISATPWVGVALGLFFIAALGAIFQPESAHEMALLILATFSPMTLFAMERGNADTVVFLLLICASTLHSGSRQRRAGSHALILLAGLLKFYPLALLVAIARERPRDFILPAMVATIVLGTFGFYYHHEILAALRNIPLGPYYGDSFGARLLPTALSPLARRALGQPDLPFGIVAIALFGTLLFLCGFFVFQHLQTLGTDPVDWTGGARTRLAFGCLILVGCFLAGTNHGYRGIFLLLAIPGLINLRRSAGTPAARKLLGAAVGISLFLMWSEFFRVHLPSLRARAVFFLCRESAWWWLVSVYAALGLSYLQVLPLFRSSVARIRTSRSGTRTRI